MRRREGGMFLAGVMLYGLLVDCFYRSLVPFALFPAVYPFFRRWCIRQIQERQRERMKQQFRDFLLSVSSAMKVGYSMENALLEAGQDLRHLYPAGLLLDTELQELERRLQLNQPVEEVFDAFAQKTDMEEAALFSSVLTCGKRAGGNLVQITRETATQLGDKMKIQQEIRAALSSQILQSRIMCLAPVLILLYVQLTAPDFLDAVYTGLTGRLFMTGCLSVYLLGVRLTEKMVKEGATCMYCC